MLVKDVTEVINGFTKIQFMDKAGRFYPGENVSEWRVINIVPIPGSKDGIRIVIE